MPAEEVPIDSQKPLSAAPAARPSGDSPEPPPAPQPQPSNPLPKRPAQPQPVSPDNTAAVSSPAFGTHDVTFGLSGLSPKAGQSATVQDPAVRPAGYQE
jgi:hypothetical protein